MDKIHIDIETFSSTDIKTAGAYKYTASLDFQILLVAYAFNDEPVTVVDLAQGEELPKRFTDAMSSPDTEKWAHNATFERQSFNNYGLSTRIEEWFCTAVKSAYCGYPLGLAAVSKAMSLKDKAKLSSGRALIKYFCLPCKPTKVNGGRIRNYPRHDLAKWEAFKNYCLQDVEAERAIDDNLSGYAIPYFERANYILDQEINDRGVLLDLELAGSATKIDSIQSKKLKQELKDLTGLENPNSPAQLKKWLGKAMQKEIKTLAKTEIPKLIKEANNQTVTEALTLRSKLSKTSIKKYLSMVNCAGEDSRARGLLQFCGASRTGRWAGRLIQVQNLRRNYLKDLEACRAVIRSGDHDLATMLYGNLADVLSQLIRTAFVASFGKLFFVADFSAIEARVIAWLAGEGWRLEVFRTHGKIYEASAAMMFGVPIELVTKGSKYREKGKIAELALGYQGSVGALKTMGGEAMGIGTSEMKAIVTKWRSANPKIARLWKETELNVKKALRTRKAIKCSSGKLTYRYDGTALTIELPSGRKLFYQSPGLIDGMYGKAIVYKGMVQKTHQWGNVDTYGGKLVENIVQAIARDLLADSMRRLDSHGYKIVMHVHDEAVCEMPDKGGVANVETLQDMCHIMGESVPWAEGLPLNADGYITPFYKKD